MNCLNTDFIITQSKRKGNFFFDFIYKLFITKLEIIRKYLDDNFKGEFIVFFSSFSNVVGE